MPQPFLLLIAANLALAGFLGWKWSSWPVSAWLEVQRSKAVFFLALYDSINDMKHLWNCLHHTSAVPQPFLLLIAANLALAGFLGWKWSLWPVPAWLAVQRSKAVFSLTLYDNINDMKYFQNCLHPTSALPQPFLLLISANLALAGFLGWKLSLWPLSTWLEVQQIKAVFFLTLYDSINDMKYFRNFLHYTSAVPQPFLLLTAANLAQAGFLGWKWSLWPVPAWLAVQRSKALFFLALYDIINDMKYFRNCLHHTSALPQPFLLLTAANLAQAGCLYYQWYETFLNSLHHTVHSPIHQMYTLY